MGSQLRYIVWDMTSVINVTFYFEKLKAIFKRKNMNLLPIVLFF